MLNGIIFPLIDYYYYYYYCHITIIFKIVKTSSVKTVLAFAFVQ